MPKNNENKENLDNNVIEYDNIFEKEVIEKLPEIGNLALNYLDSIIDSTEKNLKSRKNQEIIQKANSTEKVSKKKEKISITPIETEYIETKIQTEDVFEYDFSKMKEQILFYSDMIIGFVNSALRKHDIKEITKEELIKLVDSTVDLFGKSVKANVQTVQTSLNFAKTFRKVVNFGLSLWNLIYPRLNSIKNTITKIRAKQKVKQLEAKTKYIENRDYAGKPE